MRVTALILGVMVGMTVAVQTESLQSLDRRGVLTPRGVVISPCSEGCVSDPMLCTHRFL